MAVVREPNRTRPAVRLHRPDDEVRESFSTEFDVEWFVEFAEGEFVQSRWRGVSGPADGEVVDESDPCTVTHPDGTIAARLSGWIHLEDEPVPARLVDIAARHGNGLPRTGRVSPAILIPTGSHRPLEPDELDADHDLGPWAR
jgi:hypothetical protein